MLEREVRLNRFGIGTFNMAVADLREEEWNRPPAAGGHPPLWIVGHLALVADNAVRFCGLEKKLGDEWTQAFNVGSSDKVANPERFPMAATIETLRTNYARLQEAVLQADASTLDQPHGLKMFENAPLKTRGDVLALILTSHFSLHMGQLSIWRRQHGRPAMF